MPLLLTIAIPTYNRSRDLRHTLEILLPQCTPEVEVIVLDNASTDDTVAMVESFGEKVTLARHASNLGADGNYLASLRAGTGAYLWTLADDDAPVANVIESVLSVIREKQPSFICLKEGWTSSDLTGVFPEAAPATWAILDPDRYIIESRFSSPFMSVYIARRDNIHLDFIEKWSGTGLTPAASALSSAGAGRTIAFPDKELIWGRITVGSYDAVAVFSRHISRLLFTACPPEWYSPASRKQAMEWVIEHALAFHMAHWRLRASSIRGMFATCWRYPVFWRKVVPVLLKRLPGEFRKGLALRTRLQKLLGR